MAASDEVIPESILNKMKVDRWLDELFKDLPKQEECGTCPRLERIKSDFQDNFILTVEDVLLVTEEQMIAMDIPVGIRNRITNYAAMKNKTSSNGSKTTE